MLDISTNKRKGKLVVVPRLRLTFFFPQTLMRASKILCCWEMLKKELPFSKNKDCCHLLSCAHKTTA